MCCILCSISLFVSSHRLINAELTPKWLGMMAGIGIAGVALSIWNREKHYNANSLLFFLISGFLLVLVRNWVTLGFNPTLFMNLCGLGLLFFLLQQMVAECPPRYFYGTIIVLAVALSLHGIFQYTGVLPTANNHAVVGSFDNPAGFAAALICVLPFCFLFFSEKTPYLRYAAMAAAALMAIAVILSGSRAGMLAVAVAATVWVFSKIKNQKTKIALALFVIALPVALYFFKKDSADISFYKTPKIKYFREL